MTVNELAEALEKLCSHGFADDVVYAFDADADKYLPVTGALVMLNNKVTIQTDRD